MRIDDEISEPGAQVHDDAVANIAPGHPAPRASWNQVQVRLARLAHERNDIVLALRNRNRRGQNAVDTRTLGVGRADTSVGDEHAPNLTRGKRNVKLRFRWLRRLPRLLRRARLLPRVLS